jgi:ABC-type uncharacterized transport system involved in gliding motility auxiliary subunit
MSKARTFADRYLFSTLGILALLALAVAANALLHRVNLRVDLTENRLYSLSPGSRNILADLGERLGPDGKVTLRLYRSRSDNVMPVWLRSFATRVEDLLGEYVENGGGRVVLEVLDPTPDSDAEDAAAMDGVSGQTMPNGNRLYLGLAVRCLDRTSVLPFLSPMDEAKLEYDITRSIYESSLMEKPTVGLVSALTIMGGAVAPYMAMNQRPKPPWIFMQELQRNFTVRELGPAPTAIPAEIGVVLVIHPKALPEPAVYALDQFLMRGGKLIVALDPHSLADARSSPEAMMGQQPMPGSSNLPALLKAWGLEFSADKVVADLDLAMRGQREDGQVESYPCVLAERNFAGAEDVVMSSMTHINLVYAGAFSGEPAAGLTLVPLLSSSRNSQMVDGYLAEGTGATLLKTFVADDQVKPILLRLQGRFPSAFPGGPPGGDEADAAQLADQAAKHLAEATSDSAVVLLGDVDFLADEFCVTRQNILGQSLIRPFNDNLALIQGLVEFLAGSNDLISIRAKKAEERPFTRIVKMQAAVQDRYQAEINKLEEQREQTQMRLNEIQRRRNDANQLALTPEQADELRRYEQQNAATNQELKLLRKKLRTDIDRLQVRLQVLNIVGVPLLVILCGIGVWWLKHLQAARRRISR